MTEFLVSPIQVATILARGWYTPGAVILAIIVIWYYLDWVREDEVEDEVRENSICPDCESELEIDEVEEGEIAHCPECDADFEVVSVEPLELTRVEGEEAYGDEADTDEKIIKNKAGFI